MIIRNFEEKDVEFIFDNWAGNSAWNGCKFDKDKNSILRLIKDFNIKKYNDKYFEQFAIVEDNVIVGMISLYEKNNEEVSVGIVIQQKFRQKGLGTKAYYQIFEYAREKGYKLLSAGVSIENFKSINFHLKLGFEIENEYTSNNKLKKQIRFVKQL